jgi:hypothetical protein
VVAIDGVVAPDAFVDSDFTTLVGVSIVFCLTMSELEKTNLVLGLLQREQTYQIETGKSDGCVLGRESRRPQHLHLP